RREADARGGVHLPDVVGLGGAGDSAGGAAAAGRRGPVAAAQPAAHGALAGDGGRRALAAQQEPEPAGAPGGVRAAPLACPVAQRGGLGAQRRAGVRVAWGHGLGAVPLPTAEEVTDGARGEAEGGGAGGGRLAALVAPPDGAADGYGDGGRHGT